METKLAFFRRRASEEYLAHANSTNADEEASHLELAKHFEKLARAEAGQQSSVEPSAIVQDRDAGTITIELSMGQ